MTWSISGPSTRTAPQARTRMTIWQYLIKDRFVLHAWYQLWPSVIEVSYNPIDTTDVRKQALVQLINVELNQGFAQSPDGDRSPMSRAALSEAAIAQAKRAEQPGVYA